MTSARWMTLDYVRGVVARHLGTSVVVLGAFAVLTLTYCNGSAHGRAAERRAMADSVRKILADSSARIETRIVTRIDTIRLATKVATAQRRAATKAIDAVKLYVDSMPHADSLPIDLVLPAIKSCERALAADSIQVAVMAAQIDDITTDRDVWKARALLDERNQPKRSRFGFKAGVGAGAAAVLAIAHFLL